MNFMKVVFVCDETIKFQVLCVQYLNFKKKICMQTKFFKEAVEVLKTLSAAAASARSEVQKLLDVLEGPAVSDTKPKSGLEAASGNRTLEYCPDFDERSTLLDGRTHAIPYPNRNYNCIIQSHDSSSL